MKVQPVITRTRGPPVPEVSLSHDCDPLAVAGWIPNNLWVLEKCMGAGIPLVVTQDVSPFSGLHQQVPCFTRAPTLQDLYFDLMQQGTYI